MTHLSYRAEITSRFRDLLVSHDLHIEKLGLYAIRDLERLHKEGPMAAAMAMRMSAGGALGKLILRKLAVYDPATKSYSATAKGAAWLAALESKDLLLRVSDAIQSIERFKEVNP